MFVYSNIEENPICHINSCQCVESIKKENRVWITERKDIPDTMYLCKICFAKKLSRNYRKSKIEMIYRSKNNDIEKFCKENGWKINCYFAEGYIEIYSTFDVWRICAINVPFQFKLYHKNMANEHDDYAKFEGFHKQKVRVSFENIMDILHYIKDHDVYIFRTKRTMNGLVRMQKQGSASAKYDKNAKSGFQKRKPIKNYRQNNFYEKQSLKNRYQTNSEQYSDLIDEKNSMRKYSQQKNRIHEREMQEYIKDCIAEIE